MPCCHKIQQAIERILNLSTDHIDIGNGQLRFNIIGRGSRGRTHLSHIGVTRSGQ